MEDNTRLIAFGILSTFVIIVFLFLFLYTTGLVGSALIGTTSYTFCCRSDFQDNFTTYATGNNTMRPTWIPQYNGLVNVTTQDTMLIQGFTPFGGDRDIHVTLNTSAVSQVVQPISMEFNYNVTSCNQTWKGSEGVTQQGASAYFFYNNTAGDDFLDAEFKMFSNNTACGNGTAQLSMFKRVNGVSTALIPFTTFYQVLNRTYNVRYEFDTFNSTNYIVRAYWNGTLLASSTNITTSDVKNGQHLLESAGTNTEFDNVIFYEYDSLSENVDNNVSTAITGIAGYISIFIGILGLVLVIGVIVYLISSVRKLQEFFS